MKQFIFFLIFAAFFFVFWYVNRCSELIQAALASGKDVFDAVSSAPTMISKRIFHLSLDLIDLMAGAAAVLITYLILMHENKVFRLGEEYGSARYGKPKDIRPYIDHKNPDNNLILTKSEMLSMQNGAMMVKNGKDYNRNKNVLVIGGSGAGKTRYFVKPNLLQMNGSYVVTDPKGTLLQECGKAFEESGYRIKVLNINGMEGMKQSLHYNPFAYIRNEADVLRLVDMIIANTSGDKQSQGNDPFWVNADKTLLQALIGYIWSCGEPEDKNITTLLDMLGECSIREENEEYHSPVDLLFNELEKDFPDHFAVRAYRKFRKGAGKTLKSVLMSCGARLAAFDIKEIRDLMLYDELELDTLGDEKTILFIINSDTDTTFNFIAAIMYSQMFNLLCDKALYTYGGQLPVHVSCILDEFYNIGKIPNFENIISVIRSRNISACPILQSKSQIEERYDKKAGVIIDNCDTLLFLGSTDMKILKEVSELLGKQTISLYNDSKSRGTQKSDSINYNKVGRELLTIDEIASLDTNECICRINGLRPFRSKKYDLTKHPRFKLTSDADRRNEFIPAWLREPVTITADERFEIFER